MSVQPAGPPRRLAALEGACGCDLHKQIIRQWGTAPRLRLLSCCTQPLTKANQPAPSLLLAAASTSGRNLFALIHLPWMASSLWLPGTWTSHTQKDPRPLYTVSADHS